MFVLSHLLDTGYKWAKDIRKHHHGVKKVVPFISHLV